MNQIFIQTINIDIWNKKEESKLSIINLKNDINKIKCTIEKYKIL